MGTKRSNKIKKIQVINTDTEFTSANVSETKEKVKSIEPEYKHNSFKEKPNNYKNKVIKEDKKRDRIEDIELNVNIEFDNEEIDTDNETRKIEVTRNVDNNNGCALVLIFFLMSGFCYYNAIFNFSGVMLIIGFIFSFLTYICIPKR